MIIEITNSYHGTTEIVEEEILEVAKNKHISGLEVTAGNLAENEVEDDWAGYYATYEEAEQATYDDILYQLKSEVAYKVIEQPMTIREVMASVTEYKDESDYIKHENDTLADLLESDFIQDITPRTYNGASDTAHFHELTPETIYNALQRDMRETDFHNDIVEYDDDLKGLSEHELLIQYIECYFRVFTLNGHLYITNK